MNIREFVFNLQKVYEEMGQAFSAFQNSTGLHCLKNCGRCCQNPDIEASVLEMLPLALKIYDEGKIEEWFDKLETTNREYCLLLVEHDQAGTGYCSSYNERPSLCRMFGVAGTLNKRQEINLSICKYIKETYPELSHSKNQEQNPETPLLTLWSSKLATLDPELIKKNFPSISPSKVHLRKYLFTLSIRPSDQSFLPLVSYRDCLFLILIFNSSLYRSG